MKMVHFSQGSEEWHKWRAGGIGASDISVLMGSNPYVTPLQLWEMKCGYGEDHKLTKAMKYGIETEPIARKWLNQHHQLSLEPLCVEDNECHFMRASLDGYDHQHQLIAEIKCPVSQKTLDKAREYQNIHKYWFHQIQWQIMLAQPKRALCALWDFRHKNCITVEMFADLKLHEEMRERAKKFWRQVQSGKPPLAQENDYRMIENESLKTYLKEYGEILEGEKVLKERKKEIKELIEDYGKEGNFKAYGFTVTHHPPRITYDIEQMRVDGIDVDEYIKSNISEGYYVIKPPKK